MYQPTLARFTARDPLPPDGEPVLFGPLPRGLRSSPPLYPYVYAENNPVMNIDPSGLACLCQGAAEDPPLPFPKPNPCLVIASHEKTRGKDCPRGYQPTPHEFGIMCIKCQGDCGKPQTYCTASAHLGLNGRPKPSCDCKGRPTANSCYLRHLSFKEPKKPCPEGQKHLGDYCVLCGGECEEPGKKCLPDLKKGEWVPECECVKIQNV